MALLTGSYIRAQRGSKRRQRERQRAGECERERLCLHISKNEILNLPGRAQGSCKSYVEGFQINFQLLIIKDKALLKISSSYDGVKRGAILRFPFSLLVFILMSKDEF